MIQLARRTNIFLLATSLLMLATAAYSQDKDQARPSSDRFAPERNPLNLEADAQHHEDGVRRRGPIRQPGIRPHWTRGPKGEMRRTPNEQQLEMRERLAELASLGDEQLETRLQKWPRYREMTLGERGQLLIKIQAVRDRFDYVAERKEKELNLDLPPEQKAGFARRFLEMRNKVDQQIAEEIKPLRTKLEDRMNAVLLREFGNYLSSSQSPGGD